MMYGLHMASDKTHARSHLPAQPNNDVLVFVILPRCLVDAAYAPAFSNHRHVVCLSKRMADVPLWVLHQFGVAVGRLRDIKLAVSLC